jgi:hypothetical protein
MNRSERSLSASRIVNFAAKLRAAFWTRPEWPAPGFEDTELGVFMGPEVSYGETKVYAGVQA